jgi:UMF1 family MFS transporter
LVPIGHEAKFFGLYEVTDKGSAWIGPLVIGAIKNATGDLKNGFWFLAVFLIIPAFLFWTLDETSGKKDAINFNDNKIAKSGMDAKRVN